jgi:hypothetical protein
MRRTRRTILHGPARRTHAACTSALLCALIAGGFGCAGEARDGARVTIDTVAGVVHVRNEGEGQWRERDVWRIGEPTLRIGALDGEDAYVFGQIAGIARADDGRIWIADGQALEIRAFDAGGDFLFRFGRSGEGPGEFGAIDGLLLTDDGHLVARDPRRFRVTHFDTAGNYIADFRLQRPYIQFGQPYWFWLDEDGNIHDRVSLSIGIQSTDSLGVIRYAPDGTVLDTVLVGELSSQTVLVLQDGRAAAGVRIPFTAAPTITVAPDGRIARAIGQNFDFDIFAADGTRVRTVERVVDALSVTAAERDSATTSMRERAEELVTGGQLQDFTMPDTRPAVSQLRADSEGNWWVGAWTVEQDEPAEYHVFDRDGVYLGVVASPFRIHTIGRDHVTGEVRDEFDASYVVVAPLTKPRD